MAHDAAAALAEPDRVRFRAPLAMVTPNSMSQLLLRSASPSSSSRAFTNMSISASPAISGGSSLITLTLSAATWVSIP